MYTDYYYYRSAEGLLTIPLLEEPMSIVCCCADMSVCLNPLGKAFFSVDDLEIPLSVSESESI